VRITPLASPLVSAAEERPLRVLVQSAFGMRRKQMRRVLRSIYALDAERADALLAASGVEPEVRPETLTPQQFVAVLRAAKRAGTKEPEPAATDV
jgi:16S rRNA (adenine1518-N6/adenine1519-N6)-dimethyltransferase